MKLMKFRRVLLLTALLAITLTAVTGGTIAWFTDSAQSANNVIQAGNLNVELYHNNNTANDAVVDTKTELFELPTLWEPGAVAWENLTVKNAGNLALKYKMVMNAGEYNMMNDGTNANLTEALKVGIVEGGIQAGSTREQVISSISGKLTTFDAFVAEGTLLPEDSALTVDGAAVESKTYGVVVYWEPTDNDNRWNVNNGKTVTAFKDTAATALKISLGVKLNATQLVAEIDSFGPDYDAPAYWAETEWYTANPDATEFTVKTLEELAGLAEIVNNGQDDFKNKTIKLGADVDLKNVNWMPIGSGSVNDTWISFNGSFDGQGHTISNLKVTKGGGWNGLFGLVGRNAVNSNVSISNLTIKNVVIEDTNRMTGAVVGQIYGNVENCHVENVTISAIPNKIDTGYDNGDKIGGIVGWLGDNGNNHYIKRCSAINVTLKAYRDVGGITGYIGSSSTVENCEVDTVTITVDQHTNHYGDKDHNAGGIVGRIYKEPVTIQNNIESNVNLYTSVNKPIDVPVAPLEKDFLYPAGTNAVMYKDMKLTGDAQIVHEENAVLGLSNVTANVDHDLIIRKSGGAICISDCDFTLTNGAKLITVGEGGIGQQVFLINVRVNGVLLTPENAGQYLEGITWFDAVPEWPETA